MADDVFSTVPEYFEDFRADVDEWIDAGNRLVVTGHFRGKTKGGQAIDVPFAHLWTMRSGKASTFHNYVDQPTWSKAWGA